jgi:hypothetical protein
LIAALSALVVACSGGGAPPTSSEGCREGTPPSGSPAEQLGWMLGTWVKEDGGDVTTERWCAGEGGSLVGENNTRGGGAVLYSEGMRVEARANTLALTSSPSGRRSAELTGSARCGPERVEELGPCANACVATFVIASPDPEPGFPRVITYARCVGEDVLMVSAHTRTIRTSSLYRRRP